MARGKNKNNGLIISYLPLKDLKENPNSARTHSDKQIAKICTSIEKFGLNLPIVIDADNTIIDGHAVYRAAKQLNLAEVPTVALTHLTKVQKRAFMIAVNKLGEEAGWDKNVLKLEFEFLIKENFDLSLTAYEVPEIDLIINDEFIMSGKSDKPDKADLLPEESVISKRVNSGDLWKLGEHYLFCGDSLKEKSFEILFGDKRANMAICDLPYNVKIDGHVCGSGKIKHSEFAMASGEMNQQEFTVFIETAFANCAKYSLDGSLHFHYMDWRHVLEIMTAGNKVYSELKNICIWNKGIGGMGQPLSLST